MSCSLNCRELSGFDLFIYSHPSSNRREVKDRSKLPSSSRKKVRSQLVVERPRRRLVVDMERNYITTRDSTIHNYLHSVTNKL